MTALFSSGLSFDRVLRTALKLHWNCAGAGQRNTLPHWQRAARWFIRATHPTNLVSFQTDWMLRLERLTHLLPILDTDQIPENNNNKNNKLNPFDLNYCSGLCGSAATIDGSAHKSYHLIRRHPVPSFMFWISLMMMTTVRTIQQSRQVQLLNKTQEFNWTWFDIDDVVTSYFNKVDYT